MNNYTPYHIHTQLSLLDSCAKYQTYVEKAKEYGMTAFAFSEHGNIYEWYHKKCAIESAGMKYIHAVEAYVTYDKTARVRDNWHVWLGAKNYDGFLELNRLVSKSYNREDGSYYFKPRIELTDIIATSDNIIITTACIAGILSAGSDSAKRLFLDFLVKNKHRCFLEIQHHNTKSQKDYNKYLEKLGIDFGIPLIAGTDSHATNDDEIEGRNIIIKSKKIEFNDDESGWDLAFKSYDELVNAYDEQGVLTKATYLKAIENTNVLADMVESFELSKETKYPHIYDSPIDEFKRQINEGYKNNKYVKERYTKAEVKAIVDEELDVYQKTKSIDFMLLQSYLRKWEREHNIKCGYSRGSCSGSFICYLLGITQMDSKKFGLNFFRFMNPSRVTNADIDTDYGEQDREKVKEYLLKDHLNLPQVQCSEIITFNTIALRGAIRDVCRGLYAESKPKEYLKMADRICDLAEKDEAEAHKLYPEVFKYVDILNGTVVSVGSHPSGVLVADVDLASQVGLCSLSTSDYPVSMLNMKELDSLMYVKLDILGLDNIGIINDTCKLLNIDRMSPDNVDLEDEKVWKSIRDDTTLIFQWESDSAQAYLKKFMSDETLAIAKKTNPNFSYIKWFSFGNGLIRPGCASFRDNVANGEILTTGFKELDNFLAMTFGRITMQEDIMRFLVKFCGYNDAESDSVRRLIAKKYGTESAIDEIHTRFVDYSNKTYGQPKDKLEEIFEPIKQGILDATSYAFSWNHSDAYSCIGYICGYLRYYYPLEFLTASLNTFADKIDKTITITNYASKNGIRVLSPKFRHSTDKYEFDKDTNCIYKGLSSLKYISASVADELYALKDNEYETFIDLLIDIKKTSVNARQLGVLISVDFFSEFGGIHTLLKQVEQFEAIYNKKQFKKDKLLCPEFLCAKYAESETPKMFKNVDTVALLKDWVGRTEYPKTTVYDKLVLESEYLGYCVTTSKKASDLLYFVCDITGYSNNVLSLYNIKTGDTKTEKYTRGRAKPIKKNSIIKIGGEISRQKYIKTGIDDDGKPIFGRSEEREMVIEAYEILKEPSET